MSVAWFTRLYELNEAGRFDEVIALSKRHLAARPKDYALHLQRAKALLALGHFDEARAHVDAAVKFSKALAAWPWFYRAALHARLGERAPMLEAIATALRLDPKLHDEFADSPWFAAAATTRAFRRLVKPTRRRAAQAPVRAATPRRKRPPARAPSRAKGRRRAR
ncbi:MAG: tetratricopeptide repeat protein [Myxococcota bacterium]